MDPNKPALEPPPGVKSNFDNPPNHNVEAHFAIAISVFLVFTSGSLRAYSKICCMKQVNLEDYIGLVALAPYFAFIWGVYNLLRTTGISVHQWNIRASDVPSALYIVYTNTSFFQATMGSIKAAILLEWTRIFVPAGTRTAFWWTCQIVMWVNILYYTIVVIISAISCSPHEKIWHPSLPGQCFNTKAFFISNAVLNLTSDIIILALPHRIIWSLKMSRQKKIGTSVVFAVGIVASLVGAGRLSRAVMYYLSNDNLYNVSSVFLWCTAELSIAFLVFCLPAVPKIFSSNNWIKQSATRLYLWLGFEKARPSEVPAVDRKGATWNSSTFSRGTTLGTGWDQYSRLPHPPHAHVAPYPALGVYTPDATKSFISHTDIYKDSRGYAERNWPSVWPSHHDPSTSWYEAS
ncbi:hypothetical protein GGR51DRAFT_569384 [Nemania sp. FL0031]|nr:hypothetical protein GGR51DRAFT_569384 [Nemania sp. FL0031]